MPEEFSPTLGVVAISRNEQRDMPGFLEHLSTWVDEIIIVDDGSCDDTCAIVEAAPAKVKLIHHAMTPAGGFSELRNVGIRAASADWLLNMDIDERVPPALAAEIRSAIVNTDLNAFCFRRLNFFLHRPMRGGGWADWNHPHLARKGRHRYENRLHERCVVDGGQKKIGQLNACMWHLNDETYEERLRKSMQYSKLEALALTRKGIRPGVFRLAFHPSLVFFKNFVLKKGFVDGMPGFISALHSACATFRIYALAWDEQNQLPREELEAEVAQLWAAYRQDKA